MREQQLQRPMIPACLRGNRWVNSRLYRITERRRRLEKSQYHLRLPRCLHQRQLRWKPNATRRTGYAHGTWETRRTVPTVDAGVVDGAASQVGSRQTATTSRPEKERCGHQADPLRSSRRRKTKRSEEKTLRHQGQGCSTEESRGKCWRGSMTEKRGYWSRAESTHGGGWIETRTTSPRQTAELA